MHDVNVPCCHHDITVCRTVQLGGYSVPLDTKPLRELIHLLATQHGDPALERRGRGEGPLIIHCSSGLPCKPSALCPVGNELLADIL
jgi:hypothetical protein